MPASLDLEATAKSTGALRRRRAISDPASLLRLALGYGPGGLSLRGAAAWAELTGLASLSDVAILKRLRGAGDWLARIVGALLASRPRERKRRHRLKLIDATTVCPPGTACALWRLHVQYDPARARFDAVQLTDERGGEHLERFSVAPGDLVIANRSYARAGGLRHVVDHGADFIVRSGWKVPRLRHAGGRERLDVLAAVAALGADEVADLDVAAHVDHPGGPLALRLIAVRQSDAAAEHHRKRVELRSRVKQRVINPRTLDAAGYFFVLTSLPRRTHPPRRVLALYRVRWQVELAFMRLKSLLHLDRLPERDKGLARSWIYAHLIAALLVDASAQQLLGSAAVRRTTTHRPASLWRIHKALVASVTGAALGRFDPEAMRRSAAFIVRHICDPPRDRLVQMQALAWAVEL
ncbi:IS4 family transposase [Sphingomonas sp. CCH5-D11]|uniref:IS4 family transposase n=1 Tax=Sphingomonas sp. CCH5-D11 TaxID=1768786 RepID=UPI0008332888|nr:IS4 family transposase [Sphingomonas sp. CCH5-D11]